MEQQCIERGIHHGGRQIIVEREQTEVNRLKILGSIPLLGGSKKRRLSRRTRYQHPEGAFDPLTANYKDLKGGKERGKGWEGGKGKKEGKLEIIFPGKERGGREGRIEREKWKK